MLESDVAAAIASVPSLAAQPLATWRLTPLPSLTNRVWRLTGPGGDYVLRLENAAPYLDRAREGHNHRLAAGIGLAPPLIHHDANCGVMVTAFAADAVSFDHAADRMAAIEFVAHGLRKLHRSNIAFEGEMRLGSTMDQYLDIAGGAGMPVAGVWLHWRDSIEPALSRIEARLVPSHVDPIPDNILLVEHGAATGVRFIDWEYSAPAAAVWDLADFSIEAKLNPAEQRTLLAAYAGTAADIIVPAFQLYQAMLDLLAAAWGASQMALSRRRADHRGLIETRLARARAALGQPGFDRLVDEAARYGVISVGPGH